MKFNYLFSIKQMSNSNMNLDMQKKKFITIKNKYV